MVKSGSFFLVFFLAGTCLLSSCGDVTYDGTGTYESTTISSFQTKLYAKSGEITNRSVIDKFVKVHGEFEPNMDMIVSNYRYRATYVGDSTVVVKSLVSRSVDSMSVIDRDGLVIWESRDTVKNQYARQLDAFKYKRLHYSEVLLNEDTVITNFLNCLFLKPSGPDLLMPVTFYYHKKGTGSSITERMGKGNNEFNPDYMSGLGDTDTILVYRYMICLQKQ